LPDTVFLKCEIQDQDSWKGGTGRADSTAQVTFQRGFPSVTCRRSRLVCKGVYACLGIDPALLDVERYDLDPATRLKVFAAQKATRTDEKSSVEQRAATYAPPIYLLIYDSDVFLDFLMCAALAVLLSIVMGKLVLVNPK
jgi:hypothetical protein